MNKPRGDEVAFMYYGSFPLLPDVWFLCVPRTVSLPNNPQIQIDLCPSLYPRLTADIRDSGYSF